jgi:hypothetical protein
MKLLSNIHFYVRCIISFNCLLKSLLHHQQVPVSTFIIKDSLKLKTSDAETVCSLELLPTAFFVILVSFVYRDTD